MNKKYFLSVIFTIATTYYSCEEKVPGLLGCTDQSASNYNELATIDDDSCVYGDISGCTDPAATNYNPAATNDNESCTYSLNCNSDFYDSDWILDCTGQGCANEAWLGDGWCDDNFSITIINADGSPFLQEDGSSPSGMSLSCYNNDGGDCPGFQDPNNPHQKMIDLSIIKY